jgi:hypothetical protein
MRRYLKLALKPSSTGRGIAVGRIRLLRRAISRTKRSFLLCIAWFVWNVNRFCDWYSEVRIDQLRERARDSIQTKGNGFEDTSRFAVTTPQSRLPLEWGMMRICRVTSGSVWGTLPYMAEKKGHP